MSARPEPAWRHGSAARTTVLLVNLGTPDAPTAPALRRYLAEFLSDPRVVEIPRLVWWPILHGIILRTRPAKSAAKYAGIWTPAGSPLAVWTAAQRDGVARALAARGHEVDVRMAMRYGNPSIASALDAARAEGATRVLVLPMYPQYSAATTGSVVDAVGQWARGARFVPELRFVGAHADDDGYIGAMAARVRAHWAEHGRGEKLVLSFHGVPERTLHLGDPYHCQCHKTARLLAERLQLPPDAWKLTFQSRFGKAEWLKPYTEPTLVDMARAGVKRVDVFCPGFVADCLETLEEIAQEARDAFVAAGGQQLAYIPALNDDAAWIDAMVSLLERHLQGWPTQRPDAAQAAERSAALARQRERALAMGASD